ncbi:long-chain fatty acid--CoA ligase [Micromonosporaceae bacterium B7E4]
MRGLMQDGSLDVGRLMRRADLGFRHKRVVTATASGETISTWGEVIDRARRLSAVLDLLEVPNSARVGTFGWNSQRHVELYLGVPSAGRILHTINHRLFARDLVHIMSDAADDIVFVDRSLLGTVWDAIRSIPTVRWIVVMDDGGDEKIPVDPRVADYEVLLARCPEPAAATCVDENDAASLCYTSGTTGRPRGVLYSHRSIVLHAMLLLGVDSFAISERDVVMPIVPMFHVNAWGLPYAAVLAGAELVLPGPATAPTDLIQHLSRHRVTFSAGVPAIWRGLEPLLGTADLSSLRMVVSGGSALPEALSQAWERAVGVPITSSWGMTETSPLVACGRVSSAHDALPAGERRRLLGHPGPTMPLVDVRIVDAERRPVERDGTASGELQVAGPTIAASYFGADPGTSSFTDDGWLRTGDVATLDEFGYLRIVDRIKDMIKSGGEWISSVTLENELMAHPAVREAAVIGVVDDHWGERPWAYVVLAAGVGVDETGLREYLRGRVASWWIPDRFVVIDEIPKTATGKFSKVALRDLTESVARSRPA